jgi:hypothetical protein
MGGKIVDADRKEKGTRHVIKQIDSEFSEIISRQYPLQEP